MNKIMTVVACSVVLFGCKSRPLTPEQSWSDYGHYYHPTGEIADNTPAEALDMRVVKSKQSNSTIATLKAQGYVVLGSFVIADDTEISPNAVKALAQKLNAGAAVWTTENVIGANSALPNPDQGIVGVDKIQMAAMNADRPDDSFANQIITHKHTIWMLGKKKTK